MIYGYIRVSTEKQAVENQRFEIKNYCKKHHLKIEKWVSETISGKTNLHSRAIGKILKDLKNNDIIIATELSRFGRNLMQVMSLLNFCMEQKVKVLTIKENYELGDNMVSQVLAFAFSLSAEIEHQLISQRTKEALSRKRAEGIRLGRPKGARSRKTKLSGEEPRIIRLLQEGKSIKHISNILRVHRHTLEQKLKEMKNK